jgi:linoleoyl-CoA desaturase
MRETRAEVERYLADPAVRRRGLVRLYLKVPVALALMVGSWIGLVLGDPGLLLAAVFAAGLVAGSLLLALSVQHDANHGAYFRSTRYNHLLGWSGDALLGFSSFAWRVKHNVAHHTYTNVDEFDVDITQTPLARLAPMQRRRPWYRYQHIYVWSLYALMAPRLQIVGDAFAFSCGRLGRHRLRFPRGWDLTGLLVGKAIFVTWAFVIPMLVYPWWVVLAAYAVLICATSLAMVMVFQLAHCVEEASLTDPSELDVRRQVWAVHQVETTVDFAPRNRVLSWWIGGLNYQIEHHLFPRLPHTHYPQIAPIVRRNAARHGVRYTVQPNVRIALRSHFRHLRRMGRLGLAPELEMG